MANGMRDRYVENAPPQSYLFDNGSREKVQSKRDLQ